MEEPEAQAAALQLFGGKLFVVHLAVPSVSAGFTARLRKLVLKSICELLMTDTSWSNSYRSSPVPVGPYLPAPCLLSPRHACLQTCPPAAHWQPLQLDSRHAPSPLHLCTHAC